MRASGISGVLLVCATLWTGQATAEIELALDHDWFTVEVLIFEQTAESQVPSEAPSDTPSDTQGELLSTRARRAYPVNLLAPVFADLAEPGGGFAPLGATAEPWPEPPPPEDGWFAEGTTEPLDGPGTDDDPEIAGEPEAVADEAVEEPADDPNEPLLDLPEPPPSPRQLLEQAASDALAEYQAALAADMYRWRSDPAQLALRAPARAITRRGVGRVLTHGAWLQPVPARDDPQPILIQSDEAIADRWRIEGTLAITLGRFLHVAAELWYQSDLTGGRPGSPDAEGSSSSGDSAGPGGWFSLPDGGSPQAAVLAGIPFNLDDAVDPGLPYEVLSEVRRMRSGELHYLDHPSFGVLIRVDPVEPPPALLELFEQLEEAVE